MSLYYEAAEILEKADNVTGSLASRVYGNKSLKSKPAHIFALISEAGKWSSILSLIIEKADVLHLEKKLTPTLTLLLTHDLLLAKHGIAAPKDHVLRLALERHKARLGAEFVKARLKGGFATLQAWRVDVEEVYSQSGIDQDLGKVRHPRWIRINTLRTNFDEELRATFENYDYPVALSDVLQSGKKALAVDEHIPNLIAIPQLNDIASSPSFRQGRLIFQDKASCFSAYLLDPKPEDGKIIDACAAPGNKTTHLASLLMEAQQSTANKYIDGQQIFACERDKTRAVTLQKMVSIANANVQCLAGQDFLRLSPEDSKWRDVGALLLDPSCSGSGIVGRDDESEVMPVISLPRPTGSISGDTQRNMRGKKRKRREDLPPNENTKTPQSIEEVEAKTFASPTAENGEIKDVKASLDARLSSLSAFQLKIIEHSFSFPSAKKVVYSTCSIHCEENERVVLRALASPIAKKRGWRILKRGSQVDGMKRWPVRGDAAAINILMEQDATCGGKQDSAARTWTQQEMQEIAEGCLRCVKGTLQGTMGFFVAGFVRDELENGSPSDHKFKRSTIRRIENEDSDASSFKGFSDDE